MKKLIVASNNQHKISEIKTMLSKYEVSVLSMKEAGIEIDIDENGNTFEENSYIKAKTIFNLLKGESMVLADDSGLMVDYLNGEPGVYSARYAGEHGNDKKNNEKLLNLLKGVPYEKRTAKFVSAIVLIVNENTVIKVQGEAHGYIIEHEMGSNGFGYDPLFFVPRFNKTFAQLTANEKNSISHRGNALKKLEEKINGIL